MSDGVRDFQESWDDGDWALLDRLTRQVEEAWASGSEPDLGQWLPPAPDPRRVRILARLIGVDRECRKRAGRPRTAEEYMQQWPELRGNPEFGSGSVEQTEVCTPREPPVPAGALHIRCPHCHNPVAVVTDDPLVDIECTSCGSHFSLTSVQPTSPHLPAGSRKIGKFTLVEQVGLGQFGSVWKAHDTTLDRWVAVKIPRRGQLDPEETELFLREARAAAQVKHANIVPVHEVGREDETLYMVSDFVEGANLQEWLSAQRLTPREAAELCVKIAEALHAAHEAGLVHRDLKPGNIMLDAAGEPHITDFGLAKRESGEITMTMDGRVLGTPAYMSPEQARGKGHEADRRSDVYSLGVILFELLTGELPFRGETRMLVVQILRDEPPSPRKLNHRVPRDLETICLKCLEKDPSRRYATAQALADDLRRHLSAEAITARPVSKAERAWRWCRRNPAVAGLVAAVFFSLLAGAVVSSYFAAQSSRRANENFVLAQNEMVARTESDTRRKEAEDNAELARRNSYIAEALSNYPCVQYVGQGGNEPIPRLNGGLTWPGHVKARTRSQIGETITSRS